MKDTRSIKDDDRVLYVDCKKPWQVGIGHWAAKFKGSVHEDKRVDKPGSGGRKRDRLRKDLRDV